MIWNIALLALTAAGLWLLIEHLLYRFDQEAKRRHYHDEFLARMDESQWPEVRR